MKKLLVLFFALWTTASSFAQTELGNINEEDLNAIGKEFAANFSHAPVMPPIGLGEVFGLELGIAAGETEVPEFNRLVKEENPTAKDISLVHAGVIVGISVPMGITGELVILPSLGSSELTLSNTSFGIKWNFGQYLFKSDSLKMAARFHTSSSALSFSQMDGLVTTNVSFDTTTTGVNVMAAYDLNILQPYFGLGFISGGTEVSFTGSTIFDPSFTVGTTAESSESSLHWLAGMQLDLLFIHLGVEYQNFFGTSKYTGKVSLAF